MAGYAIPAFTPLTVALYVGDLDPTVDEGLLHEVFRQCGNISSVRVCRDKLTGNSLRYAYVNFFSKSQAEKALKFLNHTTLRGKQMRIMWSLRDPISRRTGEGNVFVKNLPQSVDGAKLEQIFGKHGVVLSCKVAMEDNGRSKGFGFVQFHSSESALSAINALHESIEFGSKKLYVAKFVRKIKRPQPDFPQSSTLFIKNLDQSINEDLLRKVFSRFGEIRKIQIVRDDEGSSRGFGFISFEKSEDTREAIETMKDALIGSKTVYVDKALTKAERAKSLEQDPNGFPNTQTKSEIFVKNLVPSADERALREIFGGCGRIRSAKVIGDLNGCSKGFGFVGFSTPDEAANAISTINGTPYKGRSLHVEMAKGKEELSSIRPHHGGESMRRSLAFPLVQQQQQMWMNGYCYPAYPYMAQPTFHYGHHVPAPGSGLPVPWRGS